MTSPLDVLEPSLRARAKKCAQPAWISPMLATLIKEPFNEPGWIYERKLDGVRCLAFRKGASVRLLSRNRQSLDATFPEIVDAVGRGTTCDAVLDGEVVAFSGSLTSFEKLQQRIGIEDPKKALAAGVPVFYYVFDVLWADGRLLTALPLAARKQVLRRALTRNKRVRLTPHRRGDGAALLRDACRRRWEGLIAKREDSVYAGRRSRDWLKLKCEGREELVIGGFTDPQGSRAGFGALLLGTFENGTLRYAGKVGTGFDTATLETLRAKLERLATKRCPFDAAPRERGVHWVEPVLVAEVAFTEWTRDGKLRHPRFLGLRTDKPATSVHRERPWRRSKR